MIVAFGTLFIVGFPSLIFLYNMGMIGTDRHRFIARLNLYMEDISYSEPLYEDWYNNFKRKVYLYFRHEKNWSMERLKNIIQDKTIDDKWLNKHRKAVYDNNLINQYDSEYNELIQQRG